MIHSKQTFFSFFEKYTGNGHNFQQLLIKFIDIWISKVSPKTIIIFTHAQADHISSAFKRKLCALALLTLFPTDNQLLLQRFSLMMNIFVEVLYEVEEVVVDLGSS